MRIIDQGKRLDLMRRIAGGERQAADDLADFYEEAGYTTLAVSIGLATCNEHSWERLQLLAALYVEDAAS